MTDPTTIKQELARLDRQRRRVLGFHTQGDEREGCIYSGKRSALNMFLEYQKITDQMNVLRAELLSMVESFEELEEKVIFLVDVYGMDQREVAEYLQYSYGYIRNIYSKNKKLTVDE